MRGRSPGVLAEPNIKNRCDKLIHGLPSLIMAQEAGNKIDALASSDVMIRTPQKGSQVTIESVLGPIKPIIRNFERSIVVSSSFKNEREIVHARFAEAGILVSEKHLGSDVTLEYYLTRSSKFILAKCQRTRLANGDFQITRRIFPLTQQQFELAVPAHQFKRALEACLADWIDRTERKLDRARHTLTELRSIPPGTGSVTSSAS